MRENRHPRPNYSSERNSSERMSEISPALFELTKKEQEHRHQWQDKYLKNNGTFFRLGQVFGLIYNLAILYVVFELAKAGEKTLALKIFALNIALIVFALIFTSIERKISSRKPQRRNGRSGRDNRFNKNHHHNNNQNHNHNNRRDQRN